MTFLLRCSEFLLISLFLLASEGFGQTPPDLNSKALTILEQNCGNLGCHGGPDPYSFDVRDPASLLAARVIQSGNASGSELIRRLEAGIMPLGGYKGQRGAKLPAEDIQILRQWIDAGGPESARLPRRVQRPFISESQVLAAIIRDLLSAPEADRPYLRYYSLANLWNSRDVEESELELYRMALSKLVNHLSWKKEIAQPRPLGSENTVLRIDLRNYGWTAETWREIIASFPYGLEPSGLSKEINRVQAPRGLVYCKREYAAFVSHDSSVTRHAGRVGDVARRPRDLRCRTESGPEIRPQELRCFSQQPCHGAAFHSLWRLLEKFRLRRQQSRAKHFQGSAGSSGGRRGNHFQFAEWSAGVLHRGQARETD